MLLIETKVCPTDFGNGKFIHGKSRNKLFAYLSYILKRILVWISTTYTWKKTYSLRSCFLKYFSIKFISYNIFIQNVF